MSFEDDRPITVYDGDQHEETPFEAEQRRGRERMIALWRSAVQCVTEAAQREAEARAAAGGDGDDETIEEAPDDQAPVVDTWVFPTKAVAAN
jgi:hypothetical protein